MKLQSNKNTTVITSIAFCLAFLSFCTPTFATYSSLAEGSFSSSPSVAIDGTGQKSLADFGRVLGQRLAGVRQELRGVADGHVLESSSSWSISSSSRSVDVANVSSGIQVHHAFQDISGHVYASYIDLLAKEGIVIGQGGKFYPDNYLRLYDVVKMLVDLYRLKVGYSLTGEQGLSLVGMPYDDSLPSRYMATALHAGFLTHIASLDPQRFVGSQDLVQLLTNIAFQFTGINRVLEISKSDLLTRGEAAKYMVMSFDISHRGVIPYSGAISYIQTPFLDVYGHPYQDAVSLLGHKGIVSTQSPWFYPDNYVHRYDFIIILVNALLATKENVLPPSYLSGFVSPFVDISTAAYSPFVYYAYDHQLLDFLTVIKRGESYFLPENLMSKHEIYTVLGKALDISFVYDSVQADHMWMTRGELAQLIVDTFHFIPTQPDVLSPSVEAQAETGLLAQLSVLLQIKELLAKL